MKDERKTKKQLIEELNELRKRNTELEKNNKKKGDDKFELLFENSPDGYYLYDLKGNFVDGNRAAEELTAYKREELIGKNFLKLKLLSPKQITEASKLLAKNVVGKSTGPDEFTLTKKDGTQVEVEILTRPVKIDNQSFILGTVRDITQRKCEEKALKDSEEKLSSFMNSASDSFYLLDSDLNFIEINKKGLEIIGKKKNEVIGKNIVDIVPDVKSSGRYDKHMEVLRTGKPFTIDHFVPHPIFGDRYFILKSFKVGTGLGIIASDITERKVAEEARRESEDRYRMLFETANDAIFIMKYDKFIDCNPNTLEMFGSTMEQIINRTPYDFSPPQQPDGKTSKEKALEKINAALKGQPQFFEWAHTTYSGVPFSVEVSLNLIEIKKEKYLFAIVRDITDRKEADRLLQDSEEKYKKIFELSPEAIVIVDQNGVLLEANNKLHEMFGSTREEIIGKTFMELPYFAEGTKSKFIEKFAQRMKGEDVQPYEIDFIAKSGEKKVIRVIGTLIKDKDSQDVQNLIMISDVTEQKKAEEKLKEKEQTQRALLNAPLDSAILVDLSGKILAINDTGARRLGKPVNELIGLGLYDYLPPKLVESRRAYGEEVVKTKKPVRFQDERAGKVFDNNIYPVFDPKGEVTAIAVYAKDISDRMQAEKALLESEQRFRNVVQASPMGIHMYELEPDDRLVFHSANAAADKILGVDNSQFIGKTIEEAFPPLIETEVPERYRRAAALGEQWYTQQIDYEHGAITGVYEVWAFQTSSNMMACMFQDITSRKKAEDALQQSEEKYRKMFELSPEPILLMDTRGVLLEANERLYQMFDNTPEENIGKNFMDLPYLTPESKTKTVQMFSRRLRGKEIPPYEIDFVTSGGEKKVGQILASLIKNKEGEVVQELAMVRDITERKWREKLTESRRDLAQALSASMNLEVALAKCFQTAIDVSGMEVGGIYLVNKPTGDLILTYSNGLSPEYNQVVSHYETNHPYSLMVMQGKPNYLKYSDYLPYMKKDPVRLKEGLKVLAIVPILYEGQVVACLNMASRVQQEIPVLARQALETIAAQIGEVIVRINAEVAVKESEERYRTLQENIPIGVFRSLPQGKIISANPAMVKMFGLDLEEDIYDVPASDFYLESQKRKELLNQLKEKGAVTGFDVQFRRKDGSVFWGSLNVKAVFGKTGEFLHMDGILEDITERKRSAEVIRRAKEEWEQTFDTVPEFISIIDKDYKIHRINQSMATKLGLKPKEVIGLTCYQVVHGTNKPPDFCPHAKLLKDEKEHTVEAFDPHLGGDYIINVAPMHNPQGQLTGAVHTAIDITERKWFEDLTRSQRDLARSLSVTMNLKEALDLCLRRAINVSGMDSGGVYLVDEGTGSLHLAHALGLSSGFIRAASHYDADSANTRLVMEGKPVYQVYDKFSNSTSITVRHIENLQVLAIVPVLYKKEVVACLNIASHNLFQISSLARQALETIAAQMGEVVVRIRAEEKLQSTTKQLKALTSHLQNVREKERIQIARELHDELSSMLTVLKMGVVKIADRIVNFSNRDEFKDIINKTVSMEEMINKSVDLVRKMITRLRPGILDDLGLIPAIEWLVEEFQSDSGMNCNLISDAEQLDLGPDESTAIFRILQEILTNIARHSKASKVDVNIIRVKNHLKLEVKDNGQGIKQSDIDQKDSFGIIGMRERANLYRWDFKIKGDQGEGTFVRLTVPLKRKKQ